MQNYKKKKFVHFLYTQSSTLALYGVVIIGITVISLLFFFVPLVKFYEHVSFSLFPSAEKAFAYGERHFNAQKTDMYDIDLADTYFKEAEKLDPTLLYVHHEIARIYFLKGNFFHAKTEITTQIAEHASSTPNSYYIRGLIEGYMKEYDESAKDYEHFLLFNPHNWAGINDYAWVLLKDGRSEDAARATTEGLKYFPDNPWLLNNNAIALYETGDYKNALVLAKQALVEVQKIGEAEWLHSYPGNDPGAAQQGIVSFKASVEDNVHTIELALASSTVQSSKHNE